MNIPQKITDDCFPSLWEIVKKEGIKTKKAIRINKVITIFSQIFFAISIFLFGSVVFCQIFKNDGSELLFFEYIEAKIIRLFPETMPIIALVIICLVLTVITPAVCCLLLRIIFSFFGVRYENNDIGKSGLDGAKAIEKAISNFKKERKHYDITWDLPEIWVYNLIFSIIFLLPMLIQLYFLSNNIINLVFGAILFGGLGGLILLLPIAGLKAISNFLCNRTCVFLTNSKEKEYTSLINILSDYINNTENEIKAKRETKQKQEEAKRQKQKQEKIMQDVIDGEKMYEEAIATEPVNQELIKDAAKLGSVSACYYLGKSLLSEWASDMYTSEEKEKLAEDAAKYFDVTRQLAAFGNLDNKTECEFLWLFSRLQYESNGKTEWQEMLNAFRNIQKSGDLSEEYSETLELAIKTVVSIIDRIDKQDNTQPMYDTEPTKTLCCKFRNGAICTKNSNSAIIYHCNYVNNPSICPTARQGGLEYR